jgi:hypothetical protein
VLKILLFPFKATRTFVKLAGVRGALLLAVGVAIGLLIAPTSGARLRAKLKARLQAPSSVPEGAGFAP